MKKCRTAVPREMDPGNQGSRPAHGVLHRRPSRSSGSEEVDLEVDVRNGIPGPVWRDGGWSMVRSTDRLIQSVHANPGALQSTSGCAWVSEGTRCRHGRPPRRGCAPPGTGTISSRSDPWVWGTHNPVCVEHQHCMPIPSLPASLAAPM